MTNVYGFVKYFTHREYFCRWWEKLPHTKVYFTYLLMVEKYDVISIHTKILKINVEKYRILGSYNIGCTIKICERNSKGC